MVNKNDNIATATILVCCHKRDYVRKDALYTPLQVGKAVSSEDLGILSDDTGDNISCKNPNFCELTGMYWAWKNLKGIDVIGLCHYRRYFYFSKEHLFKDVFNIPESKDKSYSKDFSLILKILDAYDVILPKQEVCPYNLYSDYAIHHIGEDMKEVESIVNELFPEYNQAFQWVMYKNNRISHYNMFISGWKWFDDYCEWLFQILFELEKRVHIEYYSPYQARIFGFISERLLNVYVYKNEAMKVKYYPIQMISHEQDHSQINKFFGDLKSDIAFKVCQRKWL